MADDRRASASGRAGAPADAHAGHDPEVVASLLDRELTGPDRAAAARQVASCAACAVLHADLRALATATVALATPARPRDFRLTAADVAALQQPVTGAPNRQEPVAAATRLNGEMPDSRDHATHDSLLVAALADRTIDGADRERAEALVARCGRCAELRDDLVAIRAATIALPTPPRRGDYTLSPDDVARLRPSGWRRLLGAIGSSRDGFTRPLAVGLTTLGLAGLLVATVPSVLTGTTALGPGGGALLPASGEAANDSSASGQAAVPAAGAAGSTAASPGSLLAPAASGDGAQIRAAAPSSAAASGPVYNANLASPESTPESAGAAANPSPVSDVKGAEATGNPALAAPAASLPPTSPDLTAERQAPEQQVATSAGPSALVIVSGALLLAGIGLFVLRRVGRRPIE